MRWAGHDVLLVSDLLLARAVGVVQSLLEVGQVLRCTLRKRHAAARVEKIRRVRP